MADIFISYSRQDQAYAKSLATTLESAGWSVWWDHKIAVGSSFDEEIQKQLDVSLCVIVLWSSSAVSSMYVKAEAAEALRRGVLLPIALDQARIPLPFGRIQSVRWIGSPARFEESDELGKLTSAIFNLTSKPPTSGGLRRDSEVASRSLGALEKAPRGLLPLFAAISPASLFQYVDLAPGVGLRLAPLLVALLVATGHLYGARTAIRAGLLLYAPALIACVLLYAGLLVATLGGTWPETAVPNFLKLPVGVAGIAYAISGAVAAWLKEWIRARTTFNAISRKPSPLAPSEAIIFLLAGLGLISFWHEDVSANLSRAFYVVPLSVVLLFEFKRAMLLVFLMSALLAASVHLGDFTVQAVLPWQTLTPLIVYVLLLIVAFGGSSEDEYRGRNGASPMLWAFLVALVLIGPFSYSLSKALSVSLAGMSLAAVISVGAINGQRAGFVFGSLWAVMSIPTFGLTSTAQWGAPSYLVAVAPVAGFLGGATWIRGNSWVRGVSIQSGILAFTLTSYAIGIVAWSTGLVRAPTIEDFARSMSLFVDFVVGVLALGAIRVLRFSMEPMERTRVARL